MRKILLLVVIISLMGLMTTVYGDEELKEGDLITSPDMEDEYIEGEIVVWFHDSVTDSEIDTINESFDVTIKERSIVTPNRMIIEVPVGEEQEYVDMYNALSEVRVAALNKIVEATWSPNDTYYSSQWHFNKSNFIYLEDGWDIEQGGDSSVVVAVLDTGVAYENYSVPGYEQGEVNGSTYAQAPDLSGTNFTDPYDFVHNDSHANDQNGHGTHVAGTVAQTTDNSYGVAGMAFDCTIMPIQVLNYQGSGSSYDIADGVDWARTHGADAINMSLRSLSPLPTVEAALIDAYNAGIVCIAATGNDYLSYIGYPARYDEVIAVGAVGYYGYKASYSNYGTGMELSAPGGDGSRFVWQQTYDQMGYPFNSYANVTSFAITGLQGTSMASPHVAGLVALMISYGYSGVENIRTIMQDTATDKGDSGYDTEYGYGLINCAGALTDIILSDFIALGGEDRIDLRWSVSTTENENIAGFNLYRTSVDETTLSDATESVDEENWSQINTSLITGDNPYIYVDYDVESGVNYQYKLEAVLEDNTETLGTATGGCGLPTSFEISSIYPNPVTDITNLTMVAPEKSSVVIEIYDISGRRVLTKEMGEVDKGEHTRTLNTSSLTSGVYTVKAITDENTTAVKNMVVVK